MPVECIFDLDSRYNDRHTGRVYSGQQVRNIAARLRKEGYSEAGVALVISSFGETHWPVDFPDDEFGNFFEIEEEE